MKENKLIAEFMGLELTTDGISDLYYTEELNKPRRLKHIEEYHTSWDWLKPVVDEIEQVNEGVPEQMLHVSLYSTIDEVYEAVVEFIKWYNTKKQTT